ncbi:hypothetical protein, variant 1 [Aphanomyces invadans]|uniref:Protein-L-isoaspartate O-methyltransferase n=1 Tax=Aphanomyces invadans TaxID=157072 RepID=A0A024US87_9STRA|nr:hypothetical protein, variant 1 [Aphanomyces invadans]ETW08483.1 hypothetical protein, variant 1 [Aphanomyces invadans]|eukprot:XP_008862288.1 hypothetical protein, variant 1 [Aphanomyces invadans]
MAWFASGTTNDELAMALKGHDIIKTKKVLDAFRSVDRALFVPQTMLTRAYKDYPIREGTLHLSAPHIYAQVMEALELHPGASFLNIGSGSGYLSCLVGTITGKDAINHGLEIDAGVVEACRASLMAYTSVKRRRGLVPARSNQDYDSDGGDDTSDVPDEDMLNEVPQEEVDAKEEQAATENFSVCSIVCGDVFRMDVAKNMKYDRIYVGARAPDRLLAMAKELLNPFGIVVGPFGDKLMKIRRREGNQFSELVLGNVTFAPMREVHHINNNMFSPDDTICFFPPQVWTPQRHKAYPRRFKEAVNVLLTANSGVPSNIWLRVFEYCAFEWFQEELRAEAKLRALLEIETNAREDAEKRALKAENERDKFRLLLWRQQNQIQHLMARLSRGGGHPGEPHNLDDEDDESDVVASDVFVSSDDDMSSEESL